jgi:capsular exopolysaccharide synthesis family protein
VIAHVGTANPNEHADRGAVAPRFALDRDALRSRRVVLPDEASPAASAYKMLRTQVLQKMRRHGYRAIGIASAVDGEGKSLTAVNLSLALAAEPNQTVLLLDLDLRRPSISRILGIPAIRGIEACIQGDANVADILWRPEGVQRLGVLPANHVGLASSDLLAADRMRLLIQELRSRYDDRLLVVDLPPLLLTDDVLTIAPLLDAVLLVVAEGRTRREDAARAAELLGDTPRLGTVLNQAHEVEQRVY